MHSSERPFKCPVPHVYPVWYHQSAAPHSFCFQSIHVNNDHVYMRTAYLMTHGYGLIHYSTHICIFTCLVQLCVHMNKWTLRILPWNMIWVKCIFFNQEVSHCYCDVDMKHLKAWYLHEHEKHTSSHTVHRVCVFVCSKHTQSSKSSRPLVILNLVLKTCWCYLISLMATRWQCVNLKII